MSYPLPKIPFLRLRCTLRAQEAAQLPPFKGSLLRGAFGHSLRRMVCVMGPQQACATCSLRTACTYTRLFECFIEGEPPPLLRGLPSAPRPIVFEPGDLRRGFNTGETLTFDLLLLGQAVQLQSFALLAIERMAEAGLAAGRRRFCLERVEFPDAAGGWRVGFEQGGQPWPGTVPAALPPEPPPDLQRITIRFLTPTRFQTRGELETGTDFRNLVFKALRRVLELAHFHVPGEPLDWHFRPYLEAAEAVRQVDAEFTWDDYQRYSNRQGRSLKMGGFVGHLTVEGELTPFLPLLAMAEVVHVGKGAIFGLGHLVVEAPGWPQASA